MTFRSSGIALPPKSVYLFCSKTNLLSQSPTITPSPWQLKGEGVILMFRFKKAYPELDFFVPEGLKSQFAGGLGYVMAVNYLESPVGPYKELLVIPGHFKTPAGKRQTISKIYVDSESSMVSGQHNWGIPKELAAISWTQTKGQLNIQAEKDGQTFFDMKVNKRPLKFPLTTALLPIRLYQLWEGQTYQVNPTGKGIGQLAQATLGKVDPQFFPDVSSLSCLAISVNPFWMKFP